MIQVGIEIKLKGVQLCILPKVRILKLNGLKMSVKWSLKTWDFLQMGIQFVIGFIDIFKGSLGQNLEGICLRI